MRKVCARDKFTDTTMKLLERKPLSKITVSEIVATSCLTRQSFYAHYADKYDLVNQILHDDLENWHRLIDSTEKQKEQTIIQTLITMKRKRKFYRHAFQYQGQNSLSSFLRKESYLVHSQVFLPVIVDQMPLEKADYYLRSYACSASAIVTEWAITGMQEAPEAVSELLIECMPDFLRHFYDYDAASYS